MKELISCIYAQEMASTEGLYKCFQAWRIIQISIKAVRSECNVMGIKVPEAHLTTKGAL
jgi:hypothetical protein